MLSAREPIEPLDENVEPDGFGPVGTTIIFVAIVIGMAMLIRAAVG